MPQGTSQGEHKCKGRVRIGSLWMKYNFLKSFYIKGQPNKIHHLSSLVVQIEYGWIGWSPLKGPTIHNVFLIERYCYFFILLTLIFTAYLFDIQNNHFQLRNENFLRWFLSHSWIAVDLTCTWNSNKRATDTTMIL